CLLAFFFFSSRRRHTRSLRDWSSDVCSSDLHVLTNGTILADTWLDVQSSTGTLNNLAKLVYLNGIFETAFHNEDNGGYDRFSTRSEERRVGKECRSRWSPERSEKRDTHQQPR